MFGELITWYLFFGGLSGGACLVGLFIEGCVALSCRKTQWFEAKSDCGPCRVLGWVRFQHLVGRPILLVATLAAAAGCVCLLGDMVRPEQAHLLFTRPTFSVLNVGALALASFLATLLLIFFMSMGNIQFPRVLLVCVKVIAGMLACVIVVYTGVYLNSVWTIDPWSSAFLVPLFFCSSLATGIAVPYLVVGLTNGDPLEFSAQLKALVLLDCACIVGEAISLGAMLVHLGGFAGQSSAALFFSGNTQLPFLIGFVGCGIMAPLSLDILQLKKHSVSPWHALLLGCVTLVGGYFLRFCVMDVSVAFRAMTIATLGV